MSTASPTTAPAEPPKSLGDRILGSIPVIMTVIATLLAGLSSSEMTKAQYHRSLAAQYQSKVGDQWNFFQAKRQRGAITEGQIDALRAELAVRTEQDHLTAAAQLTETLQQTVRRIETLLQVGKTASETDRLGPLRAAAERLRKEAEALPPSFRDELARLTPADAQPGPRTEQFRDPRPALNKDLAALHNDLPTVLRAIASRKPESEIAATMAPITAELLGSAIDLIDSRAVELDKATTPIVRQLDDAVKLAVQQTERLRPFHASARTVRRELDNLTEDSGEVRHLSEAVLHAAADVAALAEELVRGVQLFRNEYNEGRYTCEARYNQVIASLYEAEVRKSSLVSEKHRRRSYLFFYAMLVAQGGVTLATFALAVRQMSALWGMATLAGLAAMAAGIYVYLFI